MTREAFISIVLGGLAWLAACGELRALVACPCSSAQHSIERLCEPIRRPLIFPCCGPHHCHMVATEWAFSRIPPLPNDGNVPNTPRRFEPQQSEDEVEHAFLTSVRDTPRSFPFEVTQTVGRSRLFVSLVATNIRLQI